MQTMTIGKTARKAGVGVETIRFYERQGLVQQPPKPEGGGYRHYSEEDIGRVRFIRQAQALGFSLREIADLLSLRADPTTDAGDVLDRATAKLADVERKIAQLERFRSALKTVIATCPGQGALKSCSILEAIESAGVSPPATRRAPEGEQP